ncbi:phosphatase PAP2 family protein [Planctomicrobium piriforme]|uniref:PAP2 superfamily protein n=1 Tax=Planctomicrobium piriforme TaxID=1576369 RepID=A0A1I3G833_9PLAN|nr:phosphatase PAP2 family protein [Planctomicrobium piriforme]SFI19649.1 PAP2 superfamily protein [Planctomicrobium piriforme]
MDGLIDQLDAPPVTPRVTGLPRPPVTETSPPSITWRLPVTFLGLAVICFLFLDQPVGQFFSKRGLKGDLADAVNAAEHFGTPFGQLMILGSIAAVSCWRAGYVARILAGALAGGLAADVVKLLIARTRPRAFDYASTSMLPSFTELFPFGASGASYQSFPSAHTACAFAFAAMLTWAYPTGRRAFVIIACLAGLQRVCCGAHFLSDACAGAALGWVVGTLFFTWPPLSKSFDRLEAWWSNRLESRSRQTSSTESA